MKRCKYCNKLIFKGDQVAIVTYPVTTIDNLANYSIDKKFFDNEHIYHYTCFIGSSTRPKSYCKEIQDNYINITSLVVDEAHEILLSMGEKISRTAIQTIFIQNMPKTTEELIKLYFKKRNNV
jgi:hypothetical protein